MAMPQYCCRARRNLYGATSLETERPIAFNEQDFLRAAAALRHAEDDDVVVAYQRLRAVAGASRSADGDTTGQMVPALVRAPLCALGTGAPGHAPAPRQRQRLDLRGLDRLTRPGERTVSLHFTSATAAGAFLVELEVFARAPSATSDVPGAAALSDFLAAGCIENAARWHFGVIHGFPQQSQQLRPANGSPFWHMGELIDNPTRHPSAEAAIDEWRTGLNPDPSDELATLTDPADT